jgi:CheY-like chemotaxis protein
MRRRRRLFHGGVLYARQRTDAHFRSDYCQPFTKLFPERQEQAMLFPPRLRVLAVDDDEDCRVMLITLLNLDLIEVEAVGSAAQALSLSQTKQFDLYLLDSRLPDLSGFDLCRKLRLDEPVTPILFFSGAAYPADRRRGIEAGANAYLVKPEIEELMGTIRQFIPQASPPGRIIPFEPKPLSSLFAFEPAAA